ncbi:hypothetical protein K3495_g4228 [Podosphaera aphanis]|nr:hypothetical protein K3495_g4228 [Podosphaera aphanis]
MLIDARMPACYWPWAVEHACFITNRLYCLRTKSVPLIDFLKGLKQSHSDQIDFTNLPRFGCRAYKLIDPKPGKFEPRAEMGWFVGFQKNTNKNFLIYHPHWTLAQGWKWSESITPHASFNEDTVFGDELNSIERQHTTSYWANLSCIFSEPPSTQPPYPSHDHMSNNTPSRPQPTSQPSAPHQFTAENQREHPPSTPPFHIGP